MYKEQRRQSHITAEQKRRGNIKHGFDRLQTMVVRMSPTSAGKMSKASVLLKSESWTAQCKLWPFSCTTHIPPHPAPPLQALNTFSTCRSSGKVKKQNWNH